MSGTVALHTLGCKLNFAETSTIGREFLKNGYSVVDFQQPADVYVINTCTVTENAEKECRQIVRRVLRANPNAFVVVTGCYAQLRPDEIASIEGVDLVLGSREKFSVLQYLGDAGKHGLACVYVSPTDSLNDGFGIAASSDADTRTRAYFKVQDGCDYKCSFCTIPLARGLSRSLPPDEAVQQFTALVQRGYKEIVLTGVNVGDYGKAVQSSLYELLKAFIAVPGNFRVRVSSIEPNLLSDEIIELTASSPKLCRHFHIPLQSGSPDVLRMMQRRYSAPFYRERIEKLKNTIPDCGIGVDVIVGFPGETHTHFMETYNFLLGLPVSYLHVFTYSERPSTKAIEMPGSVPVAERRKRNAMLRVLSEKKKNEFFRSMQGSTVEVLFEHEKKDGLISGFSSNYLRVCHPYGGNLVNELVPFTITDIRDNLCYGSVSAL